MKVNFAPQQRLRSLFIITVLAAAAVEGTVLAQQHHLPTGRDAFLHYQVDSTDELIAALRKDPSLRQRYARHFGIPESKVIDFIKSALIPYKLPQGRWVDNYGVTHSGHVYSNRTYLKKGTKVWATRSGLPVLKWACANPLTKNLPGTLLSSKPRPVPAHQIVAKNVPVAPATSDELAPVVVPGPSAEVTAPAWSAPTASVSSAVVLPPLTGASTVTVPAVTTALPIPAGGGGHGSSVLPFLPIALLFPPFNGGGGSGGGNNNTPTPPVVVTTPSPAPTPSTTEIPPVPVATPTPGGSVIPTPPAPTPTPSGEVTPPTPTPTPGGTVTPPIPTPTPGGEIIPPVPTPTPSVTEVPTPGPTPPEVVPTPTPTPGGSGGGGGGITPPPGNTIPEPGTLALLAMAGAPLAWGLARRRPRR